MRDAPSPPPSRPFLLRAMTVQDVIHIDAPPEVVWRVTEDVERWPEWTPTVTSVSRLDPGPMRRGSVARIKQPAQPEAEWVVVEIEAGRRFAWETRRFGLRMVGTHVVEAEGSGTRSTLRLDAEGGIALLLWPLLRLGTQRALANENGGLKRRCEEIAREESERG